MLTRPLAAFLGLSIVGPLALLSGQSPQQPDARSKPQDNKPALTLHAESRIVLADVTVTDRHGNAVHGLTASTSRSSTTTSRSASPPSTNTTPSLHQHLHRALTQHHHQHLPAPPARPERRPARHHQPRAARPDVPPHPAHANFIKALPAGQPIAIFARHGDYTDPPAALHRRPRPPRRPPSTAPSRASSLSAASTAPTPTPSARSASISARSPAAKTSSGSPAAPPPICSTASPPSPRPPPMGPPPNSAQAAATPAASVALHSHRHTVRRRRHGHSPRGLRRARSRAHRHLPHRRPRPHHRRRRRPRPAAERDDPDRRSHRRRSHPQPQQPRARRRAHPLHRLQLLHPHLLAAELPLRRQVAQHPHHASPQSRPPPQLPPRLLRRQTPPAPSPTSASSPPCSPAIHSSRSPRPTCAALRFSSKPASTPPRHQPSRSDAEFVPLRPAAPPPKAPRPFTSTTRSPPPASHPSDRRRLPHAPPSFFAAIALDSNGERIGQTLDRVRFALAPGSPAAQASGRAADRPPQRRRLPRPRRLGPQSAVTSAHFRFPSPSAQNPVKVKASPY